MTAALYHIGDFIGVLQFWQDFQRLANRAYLLQQAVFPASNIHSDETIVSPFARDLGLAHEMMSGDTSFEAAYKVAAQHEFAYARAFINQSSCGQRRPMEAGILNDFVAISTYGPYVDAMFVDKECAELLALGRVRKDVSLKAKVFSLRTRDEFLLYLTDLAESATQEVRHSAKEIYGIF